jgi:hypothetical protein
MRARPDSGQERLWGETLTNVMCREIVFVDHQGCTYSDRGPDQGFPSGLRSAGP